MIHRILPIAAVLVTAIALAPQAAQASAYRSGNTYVHIKELPFGTGVGNGYYYTMIGGQQWVGTFTATASNSATKRTYIGTFSDTIAGSGAKPSCKGNIKLTRSINNPGPANLQVQWTITGNNGVPCPSPNGTVFTLNVVEALPTANIAGNFTASNGNTTMDAPTSSNTPGTAMTWPKWTAVAPSGLNCYQGPPTPPAFLVLPMKTVMDAVLPNGFLTFGGQSWLNTDNNHCAVRANNSSIKPNLMPF